MEQKRRKPGLLRSLAEALLHPRKYRLAMYREGQEACEQAVYEYRTKTREVFVPLEILRIPKAYRRWPWHSYWRRGWLADAERYKRQWSEAVNAPPIRGGKHGLSR